MRSRLAFIFALALGAGFALAPSLPAQVVKRALPVVEENDLPTPPPTPLNAVPKAVPVAEPRLATPAPPPIMPTTAAPVIEESKKDKERAAKAKADAMALPTETGKVVLKAAPIVDSDKPVVEAPPVKKDLAASARTVREARTMRLEIAGPRGQIVDRNGLPFAQNRVVRYLALNFPVLNPAEDKDIIDFARIRITKVNQLLGKTWDVSDEKLIAHYKDRRWLPLIFSKSGDLSVELTDEESEKLKPILGKGLMLQPSYQRHYPKGDSACHIIGYTGRRQPLPVGPIVEGEPAIEEPMGRSGMEAAFEERLRGKPGVVNLIFSPDGTKLSEEVIKRSEPGNNVVTTLDFGIQKYAENALKKHARVGGAMVILDVRNGDILAMASNPGFDLNEFIPGMSKERFDKMVKDPRTPLSGRAYQGNYFPASTFKVITALAGLESGVITPATTFDCDTAFTIGDRVFHNWNKEGEGPMNVVGAIKRSCNTWFYQAGLAVGSAKLVAMADRMGFGQAVGLPIAGEAKGLVPTDAFYMQREGHKILPGILANMSIGQVVEVSPLQAAQCMATLADGKNMPKLRLVKQVQDYNDHVLEAWEPAVRKEVNLLPVARDTVVKGMVAVVNGEGGTGHNAQLDHIVVAGKTGTAQWKVYEDHPERNRNLAWFTGFLPANNPVYAFAVVYEGSPGEKVSGGAIAAPIVHEVFDNIYKNAPTDDPLVLALKDAPRAELSDDGSLVDPADVPRAEPAQEAPPPPPEPKSIGGFFRRLFGGRP